MFNKIPSIFKNFYLLVTFPFILYVLFFAEHNIIGVIQLQTRYNKELKKKEYYLTKKNLVLKDLDELRTDKSKLERYAREKYMMKKNSEDLYIIIKDNGKN